MTERWTEEMLDRFASETRDRIANNERLIESNARVIQALANLAAEDAEERREILRRIDEQQSEVRGLQTENRRILERLEQRDRPPENNN